MSTTTASKKVALIGFACSSKLLLNSLKIVNGAIISNPVVPVMENFHFDIKDDKVVITGSDMQTTITTELPVSGAKVGQICVPAALIIQVLSSMEDEIIAFGCSNENFSVEIITNKGKGKFKIAGENPVDYLRTPQIKEGMKLSFPARMLLQAIAVTSYTIAADGSQAITLQPALAGLHIHFHSKGYTFVACDLHRLIRHDIVAETGIKNDYSVLLPKKSLTILKALLPVDDTEVFIQLDEKRVVFSIGSTTINGRLIDEKFPDYQRIIPQKENHSCMLIVDRLLLLSSLKRVNLFSNRVSKLVQLHLSEGEVKMSSEDLDYNNQADETIEGTYLGYPLVIGFNCKYFIELLSNIHWKKIEIRLKAENSAALLFEYGEGDGSQQTVQVLMPSMIKAVSD